jgi:hypothetical protein
MRRSRLFAVLILSLSILLLAGSALANSSVTLTLTGTGSNNGGGAYTYPYYFSINGGPSMPLICDTYDNEVIVGEHWTATVSSLLSGNGLFGSNTLDYKAAGLIFQDMLKGYVNPTVGNWAIWGLFSSNAAGQSYFTTSCAAALDAKYLISAATASNSQFNGLVLYVPVPGTQSWGGTPQEYIGCVSVPEPGELSLILSTLLLGLAAIVLGKRLGLKPVVSLGR